MSFFPQLVAGPIVRARDFIPQIRRPLFVTNEMFGQGVFFILSGLFKKAVISDYISINFVERIFENPSLYSGIEKGSLIPITLISQGVDPFPPQWILPWTTTLTSLYKIYVYM